MSLQDWCRRVGLADASDFAHLQGLPGLSCALGYGKMFGRRRFFETHRARVRQAYRAALRLNEQSGMTEHHIY
jgi:hypothetical protein